MRGLDTNVLVRFLTQDDPVQAKKANDLIETAAARDERLHLDVIVLCELVWVLQTAYGFDKPTVVDALDKILSAAQFAVPDRNSLRRALTAFQSKSGDFSDYAIGLRNQNAGCSDTVTFDRALRSSPLFAVL